MPIILLGLLLLIGLLIYAIARYRNSDEEDQRSVRERYPEFFGGSVRHKNPSGDDDDSEIIEAKGYVDVDSFMGDLDHMARNIKENITEAARKRGIDLSGLGRSDDNQKSPEDDSSDDSTIIFPTDNVEEEKQKRNIH